MRQKGDNKRDKKETIKETINESKAANDSSSLATHYYIIWNLDRGIIKRIKNPTNLHIIRDIKFMNDGFHQMLK